MNKKIFIISLFLLSLLLVFLFARQAQAQLVTVDKSVKVVKTDREKWRIEITAIDKKPDVATDYVFILEETECIKDGKPFNWEDIQKGWVIRVKGSLRFDTHINAKKIWVVDTGL